MSTVSRGRGWAKMGLYQISDHISWLREITVAVNPGGVWKPLGKEQLG